MNGSGTVDTGQGTDRAGRVAPAAHVGPGRRALRGAALVGAALWLWIRADEAPA